MRFIFKTRYEQDLALFKHGGQKFWYGLLLLGLDGWLGFVPEIRALD